MLFGGCADLLNFDLNGLCGNGIVEESSGESCDTHAPKDQQCGAPNTANACQYVCPEPVECPFDWACGSDARCRATSVRLEREEILDLHNDDGRIAVGDFDGDDMPDLLRVSKLEVRARYGDHVRPLADVSVTSPIRGAMYSAIGDFDNDKLDDVIIPHPLGFRVLHGTETRELLPLAIADSHAALAIRAWRVMRTDAFSPFHDLLSMRALSDRIDIYRPQSSTSVPILSTNAPCLGLSCLAVEFGPVANIDTTPGEEADELVISAAGSGLIRLYSIECEAGGCYFFLRSTIELAGRDVRQNIVFADADNNGALDLLFDPGEGERFLVAYGDGSGEFCGHAHPENGCAFDDRNVARPASFFDGLDACGDRQMPLAVADLDRDGDTDYLSNGVFLTESSTITSWLRRAACIEIGDGLPQDIEIGDFNDDGFPDAAAIWPHASELILFFGSGEGIFNRRTISFPAGATNAISGDFDGDKIDDLAVSVIGNRARLGTQVWIMYGARNFGADPPMLAIEAPLEGHVLLQGHLLGDSGRPLAEESLDDLDLVSDLVIAGTERFHLMSILAGRTERALSSVRSLQLPQGIESQAILSGHFSAVPPAFEVPKELLALTATGSVSQRRVAGAVLIGEPDRPLELECDEALYFGPAVPIDLEPTIQAIDVDGDQLDELYWIRGDQERFVLRIDHLQDKLTCERLLSMEFVESYAAGELPGGGVVVGTTFGNYGDLTAFWPDGSSVATEVPVGIAHSADAVAASEFRGRTLITVLDDAGIHLFELRADGFYYQQTLFDFTPTSHGVEPGFTSAGSGLEVVDFNGDGLSDVVIHARSTSNIPDISNRPSSLRGESGTLFYLRSSDFGR